MRFGVTSLDNRPISEYLYDYYEARKPYSFLYYCRRCIKNFEALERVSECIHCKEKHIVELPKETQHKRAQKFDIGIDWKTIVDDMTAVARMLIRKLKIAILYFALSPVDWKREFQ